MAAHIYFYKHRLYTDKENTRPRNRMQCARRLVSRGARQAVLITFAVEYKQSASHAISLVMNKCEDIIRIQERR